MNSAANKLYYEDLEIDRALIIGGRSVQREEIERFHTRFGRQRLECAPSTLSRDELSPMHMCGVLMQSLALGFLNNATSLGSPGIDSVEFFAPARIDEQLGVRSKCLHKRPLASRPEVGLAKMVYELLGEGDRLLLRWLGNQFLRVRKPIPPEAERTGTHRVNTDRIVKPQTGAPRPEADAELAVQLPLWPEQFRPGLYVALGSHRFEREEVLEYAREFDPQPFHLDEDAARQSLFGALSASGWHTATVGLGCLADTWQRSRAAVNKATEVVGDGEVPGLLALRQLGNLRWLKPVYPGDCLDYCLLVLDEPSAPLADPSAAAAPVGYVPVPVFIHARNQAGEPLFEVHSTLWMRTHGAK